MRRRHFLVDEAAGALAAGLLSLPTVRAAIPSRPAGLPKAKITRIGCYKRQWMDVIENNLIDYKERYTAILTVDRPEASLTTW